MNKFLKYSLLIFSLILWVNYSSAQLSPGELSNAHANLEGISNCTKCHILGKKETSSKCLECHKEIKQLINKNRGYHASEEAEGKNCAECHGEHFGRDFKIVRFDDKTFDHNLTGFGLKGKHTKNKCADCHKTELIKNKTSQKKGGSYLGLETECLSCHNDFHEKTLSSDCLSCHNQEAFRPAPGFDHNKTKFDLRGAHQKVDCVKCHKTETRNGKQFQEFSGIKFESCTNCHADEHKGKFGDNCLKCHTIFTFKETKVLKDFKHDKTNFALRGQHQKLDCKKCHKGKLTTPIKHKNCVDCHKDYHEGQLAKDGKITDCNSCHTVNSFKTSSFSFEKHKQTKFVLDGAHLATPCFACHKKTEKWNFNIKNQCIDCHENIHKNYMDIKYIPKNDCRNCHTVSNWKEVTFDHNKTDFKLEGKHHEAGCRDCHFKPLPNGKIVQQFSILTNSCSNCHANKHQNQFADNGETRCTRCHTNKNWIPDKFNHNTARFKLDGKHENVVCIKCHKPSADTREKFIKYKFEDISCTSCH
ncbi:MAG: hypothetical protein L3J11_03285 [Draconibacterium sp.]|nr:hypothetical protein [Draconibacterium sp.]